MLRAYKPVKRTESFLQTIDFLTKIVSIDVNAKNVFGITALDLLEIHLKDASGDYLNIGRLLQQAGAVNSRSNVSSENIGATANTMSTVAGGSTLQEILDRFLSKQEAWHEQQERNGRLESHRNAIMIAASLFAAAAFQAGANPPGGFWQDNSNSYDTKSHIAGESILAYSFPDQYPLIVTANATAFFTSSFVFLLLLSGLPLKNKICTGILMVATWIAFVAVGFSFLVSTSLTGFHIPTSHEINLPVAYTFYAVFGIIICRHIGPLLVKMDSFLASFLLGWGITIGAGLASYPIDTICRRMMMTSGQAVKYKSSMDAFAQIIKNEGAESHFKDAGANILRAISGAGVVDGYDKFQDCFLASFLLGWGITIGAGLASYPTDTERRRMMMTSGQAVKNKSCMDAFAQIIKNKGAESHFKDAGANILRAVAGAGVLAGYDKFQVIVFGKKHKSGDGG
ncbi:hypothetical protein Nepgr_024243 [Nepenthes gracilis]|uniref:ADP/ATP translocase n=1 Tax=Nepenthes gracilis TaxID=150966 RepID=A0AAD3T2R4_NEPGR|nr:hypothetical protein Nepgr_024243 [Nepenthes gracilis]